MDLHTRQRCAWIVIACALSGLARAGAQEADSLTARSLWDLQGLAASDVEADPEVVLALDALLADPADLGGGEAHRLAVLPWLRSAQVEVLQRAGAVHSLADVAELDGWDEETARSIAPFVRCAPASQRPALRAALHGTRTALSLEAHAPGVDISARRPHDGDDPGATARLSAAHWTLTAGDFRGGWLQGALLWGASGGMHVGDAVMRRSRGLVPLGDPSAAHALRGMGAEADHGRWKCALVAAHSAAGEARLAAGAGPLPAGRWTLAAGRVGAQSAASLGYELDGADRRCALEVASDARRRVSGAAGGECRLHGLTLGARVGAAPWGPLTGLSGGAHVASARHGLLRLRVQRGPTTGALALLRAADETPQGNSNRRDDQELVVTTSRAGTVVELRLRRTRTTTTGWMDVAHREWNEVERRTVRLRVRRPLARDWVVLADVQRVVARARHRAELHGEAWSVRCERMRGTLRPFAGAGLHRAPAGVELSTTLPGSALGTLRLHGDALHLTLGARLRHGALEAAGVAWLTNAAADGLQCAVRGELVLRVR